MSNETFGAAAPTAGPGTGAGAPPQGPASPPAGPPPPGQQFAPAPKPMDPKKKKKLTLLAILGGVLLLLIVAGSVTYSYLAKNVYGAERVVEEYLGALKDGNAEKALELLPAGEDLDTSLVTNEVYQATENRISDYAVVDFDGFNGGVVTADVTRAGSTAQETIRVVKDGRQNGIFPKWKIEDDLMDWSVSIIMSVTPFSPQEFTVNGVTVPAPEGSTEDGMWTAELAVLPGDYEIEPLTGNGFVSYGETETVEVEMGSPMQGFSFSPVLTEAADEAVKAELTAVLESCLASTKLDNPGCLNDADLNQPERYRNVSWSLVSGPSIDSVAGKSAYSDTFSFLATGIEIALNCEVDPGGKGEWEPYEEKNTFSEFAEAKINGDELELILD